MMRRRIPARWVVFGFCVVSFLLRVWVRYAGQGYLFFGDAATGIPESDSACFTYHALNVIAGRGFGVYMKGFPFLNYIPPGHPFILGFLYFYLGNRPDVLGWVVAAAGSALPALMYATTRVMMGRRTALVAAGLVALFPTYRYLGFSLMTEPMAILTGAVALWLWTVFLRNPGPARALCTGLVFGGAGLVRPTAIAYALSLLVWSSLLWRGRRRWILVATFTAGLLLLPAAWSLRNRAVHGAGGMPYSTISVRHVWTGANPRYGPGFYSRGAQHDTMWSDPRATERERTIRLQKETRKFVRADRARFFFGSLWRARFLRDPNARRLDSREGLRWDLRGQIIFGSIALWGLALLGGLCSLRTVTRWGKTVIPGGFWFGALGSALVLALAGAGVYGASDRYRWPVEYLLFPFAAQALVALFCIDRRPLFGKWSVDIDESRPFPCLPVSWRRALACCSRCTSAR